MSAPTEVNKPQADPVPESPTTARPLDLDDDDVQETGILGDDAPAKSPTTGTANAPGAGAAGVAATTGAAEEVAPAKPPRPMTEQQRNEQILKEAFPSIDLMVIKAVLRASGNSVEPAFNALLEMTDPDAAQQEQPPPQPPRPAMAPSQPSSTSQSQLEADEQYARQLAQHYESVGAYEARTSNRSGPDSRAQQTGPDGEREHSFLDDDLPVIRENLRKGFHETQKQVNSWITNLKKRIDEEWNEDDDDQRRQHQNQSGGRGGASMGRPSRDGGAARRSRDDDRYDADPELLSDDFAGMKFHNDGTPANRPQRPPTNPNLFKPPPPSTSPKPASDARKVAFRDDVDDTDAYGASPKEPPKDATASATSTPGVKASKWQPLSAVDPSPVAENDPFSLGDSDDEKDKSAGGAGGPIKMKDEDDEGERLRTATEEAMADNLVGDDKKKTEAAKKS